MVHQQDQQLQQQGFGGFCPGGAAAHGEVHLLQLGKGIQRLAAAALKLFMEPVRQLPEDRRVVASLGHLPPQGHVGLRSAQEHQTLLIGFGDGADGPNRADDDADLEAEALEQAVVDVGPEHQGLVVDNPLRRLHIDEDAVEDGVADDGVVVVFHVPLQVLAAVAEPHGPGADLVRRGVLLQGPELQGQHVALVQTDGEQLPVLLAAAAQVAVQHDGLEEVALHQADGGVVLLDALQLLVPAGLLRLDLLQHLGQGLHQLLLAQGLQNVVLHIVLEGLPGILELLEGRDDENLHRAVRQPGFSDQLQARNPRHPDIRHQDMGLEAVQLHQPLLAVAGRLHRDIVKAGGYHVGHRIQHDLFVIYHQQPDHECLRNQ